MSGKGGVERRFVRGLEVREAQPDSGSIGTITGYAAVFNERSLDLGGFTEIVVPGAFAESLKRGDDVRGLVGHDPRLIIGRRSAKTLRVEEDERGLRYEIDLPDTAAGRDLLASVRRGDIDGSSFGFRTITDDWKRLDDGLYVRELHQADLFDVGPATYPAYTGTTAEARELVAQLLAEGRKRVGLGEPARRNRDRLVEAHRTRMRLWWT